MSDRYNPPGRGRAGIAYREQEDRNRRRNDDRGGRPREYGDRDGGRPRDYGEGRFRDGGGQGYGKRGPPHGQGHYGNRDRDSSSSSSHYNPQHKYPRTEGPRDDMQSGPTTSSQPVVMPSNPNAQRKGCNMFIGRGGLRNDKLLDAMKMELIRTRPAQLATKQGECGRPFTVKANFFKLKAKMEWAIYQHHVKFSIDLDDQPKVKHIFLLSKTEELGTNCFLFDGQSLFSTRIIAPPDKKLELSGEIGTTEKQMVQATVKHVGTIEMGNIMYLQVFNLLVRKALMRLELQPVGRNLYDPRAAISVMEYKMDVWPSYITSIRQYDGGIMMSIELASKIMRNDTAYEMLKDCGREGDPVAEFKRRIVGETVLTRYSNKTYKVHDVDFGMTPESTFPMRDGSQVSYVDYYKQRYRINIRRMDQPLLISKPKARDVKGGKPPGLICLVPELCTLTGLTDRMRSDFNLMRALDSVTKLAPRARMNKLYEFNKRLHSNPLIQEDFYKWDLELGNQLVEIQARQYEPETIVCGNKQTVKCDGRTADWSRAFQNKPMLSVARMKSWVIIAPKRIERDVQNFLDMNLFRVANGLQFKLPSPKTYFMDNDFNRSYANAIDEVCNQGKPDMLFIVLPNNNAERYSTIKKKCYVDRAVLCQVVLLKTLKHKNAMSIATKVAIQMNCKLGGAPWTVEIPSAELMVFGFDISSDPLDRSKTYGGLVANLNQSMSSWYSIVSHHSKGEALSNEMPTLVTGALHAWVRRNKTLPKRIIFYRDGVSEGQYQQVIEHEVRNIQKALTLIYKDQPWRMAFILVTKRINTRFFMENGDQVPPNSVVDSVITQPEKYDFYLVSQSVRVGTAAPTAYNVISDNSGWIPDILQVLSSKLTYLYYNVSSSARVPAPCKYAHKLSFLAAQNLHCPAHIDLSDRLYYL